jgi:hypothetical protein
MEASLPSLREEAVVQELRQLGPTVDPRRHYLNRTAVFARWRSVFNNVLWNTYRTTRKAPIFSDRALAFRTQCNIVLYKNTKCGVNSPASFFREARAKVRITSSSHNFASRLFVLFQEPTSMTSLESSDGNNDPA